MHNSPPPKYRLHSYIIPKTTVWKRMGGEVNLFWRNKTYITSEVNHIDIMYTQNDVMKMALPL